MANRSDDANGYEAEIRRNYTMVCRCEWEDQGYDEVIVATSKDCVIHGDVDDPLLILMGDWNNLRDALVNIGREDRLLSPSTLRKLAREAIGEAESNR